MIEDAEFVEIIEPAGLGVAEDLNDGTGSQESNDNGFLALGTQTWVYDVAEGREKEFTDEPKFFGTPGVSAEASMN